MRISVLIPSDDYRKQAGSRIRYQRIEASLLAQGHELTAHPIDQFTDPAAFVDDVYVISKIHDARALFAADMARAAGRIVGVDLFDDYYSQWDNPRLVRMRLWLNEIKPKLDFLLCSTPEMRDLGARLLTDVPAHVMNDPAPAVDAGVLRTTLARKLKAAHDTGRLRMLWFGMGDNPHFSVGLSDLVAWGPELARLCAKGYDVQLDILTNRRALTADTLAMLRQLPVETRIEEWSEERETELLAESFACFLPVNGQNFSIVKSLNRAATALCSGTQVLSVGYPLYAPLEAFVYRQPQALVSDLTARQPLLRGETLGVLSDLFGQWADTEREASGFVHFLDQLDRPAAVQRKPFTAVIHGLNSPAHVHKFAKKVRGMSVASPYYRGKLNFDVKFEFIEKDEGLQILVAEQHLAALAPQIRKQTSRYGKVVDTMMYRVDSRVLGIPAIPYIPNILIRAPLAGAMFYGEVMVATKQALARLFPGVECYVSEVEALAMDVEALVGQEVA